jgi:flagellar biosynthesis protein FlhB
MSSEDRDEAVHPASEIKLARARQQGEVCRSYSLAQAIQITVGFLILSFAAMPLLQAIVDWTSDFWSRGSATSDLSSALPELIGRIGWPLGLFLCALFLCGCASHLLQTGWTWGQRPLLNRRMLEPGANLAQWFSFSRWTSSLVGIACFGLFAGWLYFNPESQLDRLALIWSDSSAGPLEAVGSQLRYWLLPVIGLLLALGGLDYGLQRWLYLQRMQMSDQELRDEQKDEQNAARSAIKSRRSAKQA